MRKFYTLFIALLSLICSVDVVAQTYTPEIPINGGKYYIFNTNATKFLGDNDGVNDTPSTCWTFNGELSDYNLTTEEGKTFSIWRTGISSTINFNTSTTRTGDDIRLKSAERNNNHSYNIQRRSGLGIYNVTARINDGRLANQGGYEWQFFTKEQVNEINIRLESVTTYSEPGVVTNGNIANPNMTWRGGTWNTQNTGAQNIQYQNTGLENGFTTAYFYENWANGKALRGKMFNQTLQTLPQGKFKLTMKVIALDQNTGATTTGVYAYVSGEKDIETTNVLLDMNVTKDYEITFENSSEQIVEYGLDFTQSTCNWVGVGSVKLEYLGPLKDNYTPLKEPFVAAYNALNEYAAILNGEQQNVVDMLSLSNTLGNGSTITYNDILNTETVFKLTSDEVIAMQNATTALEDALPAAQLKHFKLAREYAESCANNIGFAKGQYAPYNNVIALQKYQASATNYTNNTLPCSVEELKGYVTDLKTWSDLNDGDVEAIGNPDFAKDDAGWTHNTGLGASNQRTTSGGKTGYSTNGNISYGNTVGYTLNLEPNSEYELVFSYAATTNTWLVTRTELSSGGAKVSVLNSDDAGYGLKSSECNAPEKLFPEVVTTTKTFKTGKGGKYTIKLESIAASTVNNNTTFTNVHINKIYPGTKVTGENRWGTYISQVDRDLVGGLEAYTVERAEDDVLVLEQAQSIAANTPYLIKNPDNASESIELPYEKNVENKAEQNSYTHGLLTGVFAPTVVPEGSYIMQKIDGVVAFYYVNVDNYTIQPNRCYLSIPQTNGAKRSSFRLTEGVVTGIDALNSIANDEIKEIYSTNGAQQNNLQKGMNIVRLKNGKTAKILVK